MGRPGQMSVSQYGDALPFEAPTRGPGEQPEYEYGMTNYWRATPNTEYVDGIPV
jgi:hypothetical protein